MSLTVALPRDRRPERPLGLRIRTRLAICAARPLALLKPHRLRRTLVALSRGARPSDAGEATAAHASVLAASLAMNGLRACLPRSVAVALLCRTEGHWPTWCAGVRAAPPFAAHAWVEVGEQLIGEKGTHGSYARLITVPPRGSSAQAQAPAPAPVVSAAGAADPAVPAPAEPVAAAPVLAAPGSAASASGAPASAAAPAAGPRSTDPPPTRPRAARERCPWGRRHEG